MRDQFLTKVEISQKALLGNLFLFKRIVGPKVKIMAIVKANAYGHGIVVYNTQTIKESLTLSGSEFRFMDFGP